MVDDLVNDLMVGDEGDCLHLGATCGIDKWVNLVDHLNMLGISRTIPVYKDGQPVDQIVGVTPNYESDLRKKIESYL